MKVIIGLGAILGLLFVLPAAEQVFAAGSEVGEYLDRKAAIWGLFYRLMIIAFTVGTVVSGSVSYTHLRAHET